MKHTKGASYHHTLTPTSARTRQQPRGLGARHPPPVDKPGRPAKARGCALDKQARPRARRRAKIEPGRPQRTHAERDPRTMTKSTTPRRHAPLPGEWCARGPPGRGQRAQRPRPLTARSRLPGPRAARRPARALPLRLPDPPGRPTPATPPGTPSGRASADPLAYAKSVHKEPRPRTPGRPGGVHPTTSTASARSAAQQDHP